MVKQYKVDEVSSLKDQLGKTKNIILTNYSGVKVKGLSVLRNQLREKGAVYKVVKNNYFKLALDGAGYTGLDDYLKGPIAVAFIENEVGEVAKILKDFSKDEKNFSFFAGVMDNVVYGEEEIKKIADLPSKEVLLGQIMSLLNGPASGIAMGTNQIMASLARGINAVAEKNGN